MVEGSRFKVAGWKVNQVIEKSGKLISGEIF